MEQVVSKKRVRKGELSKNLITYYDPKSPAAEAFRTLRTNIGFASIDNELKTIVFTSPEPTDGKSTVASNFAIAMAKVNKKVLLMECDLRKPRVHRNFGIGNDIGLTHILADMVFDDLSLLNIIKAIPEVENLFVLTAGFTPPNPTEMLSSKKFKNLLDQIKKHFDIIVIDTPPVAQLTDSAIISKFADGVLLVLASGETSIQGALSAKQALTNVKANILGVVLTKINKKSGSYYNYYNYEYYTEEE
jgi:capsular exopolysaccharide synthesis family protein